MKPWLIDSDLTVYHGDVLAVLRELPDESVDVVVTSPPYWGLRDYGTATWEGGDDPACDHLSGTNDQTPGPGSLLQGRPTLETEAKRNQALFRDVCGRCGARRVDEQLGLEPTIGEYLAKMVEVFEQLRRVLARHGTLWLNMGDSYGSGNRGNYDADSSPGREHDRRPRGPADKELLGVPWRLAFALQDAGWLLRADNIWAKPNPMPESVTDRPTKSHEYVFLFSKQRHYYYDREAVLEPFSAKTRGNWSRSHHAESEKLGRAGTYRREYRHPEIDAPAQAETLDPSLPPEAERGADGRRQTRRVTGEATHENHQNANGRERWPDDGRNMRTVWTIPLEGYPGAHFATFPRELARRCIRAGAPREVCRTCGEPRRDEAGCGHDDYRPGIVLDPFGGSGTTGEVARAQGRHAVLIELDLESCELIRERTQQLSLLGGDA